MLSKRPVLRITVPIFFSLSYFRPIFGFSVRFSTILHAGDSIPTCPHRFPPLHGRYVPSQQSKTTWNVQDRALYICNNGYSIQGNRSSTCLSSLSWSSAVPTCRRKRF